MFRYTITNCRRVTRLASTRPRLYERRFKSTESKNKPDDSTTPANESKTSSTSTSSSSTTDFANLNAQSQAKSDKSGGSRVWIVGFLLGLTAIGGVAYNERKFWYQHAQQLQKNQVQA
jgi:hypothetical protein